MDIEVIPLTPERFELIPLDRKERVICRSCLYWEDSRAFTEFMKGNLSMEEAAKLKRRWIEEVSEVFSPLGALALVGDEVVGYIQFSKPQFIPTIEQYDQKVSPNSLFIECLFVRPEARKRGVGSSLLEFAEEVASLNGLVCLETFASLRGDAPSSPVDFFAVKGFRIVKYGEFPLMRKCLPSSNG